MFHQFQQVHTGLVALLRHLMGGEEKPYYGSGVLGDMLCPAEEPLTISLQVGLVVRRHMPFHRTVLVGTAMEPQMRDNASPGKERSPPWSGLDVHPPFA